MLVAVLVAVLVLVSFIEVVFLAEEHGVALGNFPDAVGTMISAERRKLKQTKPQ